MAQPLANDDNRPNAADHTRGYGNPAAIYPSLLLSPPNSAMSSNISNPSSSPPNLPQPTPAIDLDERSTWSRSIRS